MGRIRTTLTKKVTTTLIREHSDKLTTNFEENKKKIAEFANLPSKKMRNVIAGYVTKRMKTEK